MFARKTTLLFIARDRLVRMDIDARGQAIGLWQRERGVTAELPELIDTAARLDRTKPGKTWVLAEDFWAQKLTVNQDMLVGLSHADAAKALGFEAESLSGQSAIDADLNFVRLEGTRERSEYWVLQVPNWVRDQAENSIRRAGGQFAGLLHPGGLPTPIDRNATGTWGRIETWSGITLAVGQASDSRMKLAIAAGDSRATAWQRAMESWLSSLGPTSRLQHLTERPQTLPLPQTAESLNLHDRHVLEAWLLQWAAFLQRSEPAVPHILPAKRPMSQGMRVAIAITLLLIVCGIAATDQILTRLQMAVLKAEIAAYQKTDQDQAAAKKQVDELEKKIKEEQKRVDRLSVAIPQTEAAVDIFRRRWTELLGILSRACPQDVVVQRIRREGNSVRIEGKSLEQPPLSDFAVELGRQLGPLGWSVAPEYEIKPEFLKHGKVYAFSLQLVDRQPNPSRPPTNTDDIASMSNREVGR
ncbi:PilN domain-containing protein [Anatilimnocola floriformis]|uniref:PilN domain-containing protein n=1 Tax=Anatilimnocola floriformis TaxID=2948575 RepID=UPI0020C25592|nr:hypothetical protein [Anatilimnocola floriformis]